MRAFLAASSTLVFGLFFAFPAAAAPCDPAGLDACVDWAEQEISASGCHMDSTTFANAVADLYLYKGCRLNGTVWTDVSTGATVKGSVSNGVNTDSAGCIARYTPSSYLQTGGYFRTPKESMNGSLRNKTISGCQLDDAGAITAPIIVQIESCTCAAGSQKTLTPTPNLDSAGASGEKEPAEEPTECPKGQAIDADTRKCRDLAVCPAERHMTRKGPFECGCEKLYDFTDEKQNDCVFWVEKKGFRFEADTRDKFQDAVLGLDGNSHAVFEESLDNGKKFRVGILKLADGSVVFSADGKHYYEDPADAVAPGWWKRAKVTFDNVGTFFGRLIGRGKYIGRNTAGEGGAVNQEEGQRRLDASNLALESLKDDAGDPEQLKEEAEAVVERWGNRIKNPTTGEYDNQILEEIKNATGIDVPMIKKVLTKDWDGLSEDALNKLYAFPVDAVITLSEELKSKSFGDAASLYISERERGDSPDLIMKKMEVGDLTELDFASNIKGVGQRYASEALFMAYEESYQRYLLKKEMEKR